MLSWLRMLGTVQQFVCGTRRPQSRHSIGRERHPPMARAPHPGSWEPVPAQQRGCAEQG